MASASQSALAKLHSPLKELVAGAAQEGSPDFGRTEKDQAEVAGWIEIVAAGNDVKAETLGDLDEQLIPKTYIVGNYLTAADVALYGALHPILSQLQPAQYYSHPAVTRYFDHIQHRPSVRKSAAALAPAFSVVSFDLEHAPKVERKPEPPKEKKKKGAATAESSATPSGASTPATPAESFPIRLGKSKSSAPETPQEVESGAATPASKKEKKEKKEKKPAEDNKKSNSKAEDVGEPVPSMIDLRVGRIVQIEKHPDADGLYVEQIDFGEDTGPRTVVSGLVHYIPIEQMRDKILVGVCNLKPANMRGVKSFAMVLCATSKDGKEAGIELIQPPAGSQPGDRVYFEGAEFENATPLSQMNPKKKIFETVQPGFTTLDTKEAAWVNPVTKSVHKIRSSKGVCIAPTLVGASLS
ncbi:hypothetical protein NM688_g5210 [Phlebia brevispora]|uniref:Uncharacterized protein n=1 Tax=Phlebia brevispora TaxID=194682 RepID=A0ACC1SYU4_9APHY|nr:hypothetical protein NM688_g5210 [Phlebia brevispora]